MAWYATISSATLNDSTVTLSVTDVTGSVSITAKATYTGSASGGEDEDSGSTTPDNTGVLASATLLTATACNVDSATTFTNDSFYTYKDIPVTAGNVYSIPGARNCYVTDSSGNYVGGLSAMLVTQASGGVDSYYLCPSTITIPSGGAYLSYCAKSAEVAAANAEALITTVIQGEPLPANNIIIINNSLQGHAYTALDVTQYFSVIGFAVTEGKTYNIPYGRNYMFTDSTGAIVGTQASGAGSTTATATVPTGATHLHVSYKKSERTTSNWSITEA